MIVKYFQHLEYASQEKSLSNPNGLYRWVNAFANKQDATTFLELVVDYLCGDVITDSWMLIDKENGQLVSEMADWFVDGLRHVPLEVLAQKLKLREYKLSESVDNIPQISSFEGSTLDILDILSKSESALDFVQLGYYLYPASSRRNETAKRKYGENASKFAAFFDLVRLDHLGVKLTPIGEAVQRAKGDRLEIVARLQFRLALFRDLLCSDDAKNEKVFCDTIFKLSKLTRIRRSTAFTAMLKIYDKYECGKPLGCKAEDLICQMRR
ncbi:MAG: hypothetical protein MJ109_02015 [Kiritimatiellae bacterium]|nr:hypothetical protein [Kiritimatiellia bacterium]